MEIRRGSSRAVILTRRRAYKLPRLASYPAFLWGLLSNMRERERSGHPGLCPILWSLPLGLLVVMPRCEAAPEALIPGGPQGDGDPDAYKSSSWGMLRGLLVRVDYHGAVDPGEVIA